MERKGMEVEYMFLVGGLILILLFVSYWQQMGLSMAAKNWGELKVQTITQIKDVILLMQKAPVETETCVPITGCDKIAIHKDYVEIWGKEKEYFKEPSYLSTALSTGMLDIYAKNDEGKLEPLKECGENGAEAGSWGGCGYVAPCGSGNSIFFVCFRKRYFEVGAGNGDYIEDPKDSGIFKAVGAGAGTHDVILVISRQADLSK